MLQAYSNVPQIPEQDFLQAETDFDLVVDCIKSARSVSSSYNLPTNGKTTKDKITGKRRPTWQDLADPATEVIIQAKKPELRQMLETQEAIIVALTKGCGTCRFISDDSEVPKGCGTEVVTTDITIHIPVQVCRFHRFA